MPIEMEIDSVLLGFRVSHGVKTKLGLDQQERNEEWLFGRHPVSISYLSIKYTKMVGSLKMHGHTFPSTRLCNHLKLKLSR